MKHDSENFSSILFYGLFFLIMYKILILNIDNREFDHAFANVKKN